MIFTPVYGPFHDAVTRGGRRIYAAPLTRDENARYHMDLERVEQRLKEGARLILLCNPHNPVSRTWHMEELAALASLARRYNALLVSDEIHADFVYTPNRHHSILTVPGADACAVMLASASKTFNVPGLQQSMAVSHNQELLDKLKENVERQGVMCGNVFALDATQAAYTQCDDWLDGLKAYLEEGREIVRQEVAVRLPRAVLTPIEATALCWLDLRAYASTCKELAERLRAHHVVLTGGTFFDKQLGEGFMRLNFACPHSSLREGVRRMAEALEKNDR